VALIARCGVLVTRRQRRHAINYCMKYCILCRLSACYNQQDLYAEWRIVGIERSEQRTLLPRSTSLKEKKLREILQTSEITYGKFPDFVYFQRRPSHCTESHLGYVTLHLGL